MTSPHSSALGRLHLALMPDYNRKAAALWWGAVVVGYAVVLGCFVQLTRTMTWLDWAQLLAGMVLAMLAGMFPLRVPGTKSSFVAGEIFIFLVLLFQGPLAATLAVAGEAAVGASRTSKRWTSRIVSPAIAAISMFGAGSLLEWSAGWITTTGWERAAPLLAAMLLFAAAYFLISAILLSGVPRLKRGESFVDLPQILDGLRWVYMAYFGGATVATLLFITYRHSGVAVLMVVAPILVLMLVALHFYFREQEATEAMRISSAAAAEREAALSARAAAVAREHLQALQASERRFHAAFTHASIGMALMGFDGTLLQVNPALARLLGRTEDDLALQPLQAHVDPSDLPALNRQLGLIGTREFEGFATEMRCVHADGRIVWAALHCSFFTEPEAARPCLILQAQDVTARREAEAGLQHLAFHDSLTGLPNRRRFLECLGSAVARHKADASRAFAVMFLDFDRFKLVNDSLGHAAGDELLGLLARRIQENLRPSDIVARLGGDEFAILVEQPGSERDVILLAERLKIALQQPFRLGQVEVVSGASIGITFSAFGYDSGDAVLRDADAAMYKAKGSGSTGYAIFDASLHTAVSDRLRLEGQLRQAIEQGQLVLEYQPLFDLASNQLQGFESLVRWNHPDGATMGPAAFLHIAQEAGLMHQVSDFVLHCACHQLRQWQLSDPSLRQLTMSINISADELVHPAFPARVSRALVESGLDPVHLTLELTEGALMTDLARSTEALQHLRALGVRLAVDDFGTGHSSLSHLPRLPIDALKIDRSFIRNLAAGSDESAVLQAIIQLGRSLRKAVVAEGIESALQLRQLRELGCPLGQGFHLATPLSAQAANELLMQQRPAHYN
mgnify:CR=1 FL=1